MELQMNRTSIWNKLKWEIELVSKTVSEKELESEFESYLHSKSVL